jgi:CheY-like chemotaxis protein
VSARGPVLVVDDDDDIREVLGQVLEDLGCAVISARTGREALSIVRELKAPPPLILLDLMMPVMSGWQFLEHAERDGLIGSCQVVVMSAAKDVAVPSASVKSVLRKPLSYDELEVLVSAL